MPKTLREFVEYMARLTTLEEEFNAETPDGEELREQYENADEHRADISDDRLLDKLSAFETMIVEARAVLARPDPVHETLTAMQKAYSALHDRLSPIVEGDVVWSEEERAALADMLATCCEADAAARRSLDGEPAKPDPLRDNAPELLRLVKRLRETAEWLVKKRRAEGDEEGARLNHLFIVMEIDPAIARAEGRAGADA